LKAKAVERSSMKLYVSVDGSYIEYEYYAEVYTDFYADFFNGIAVLFKVSAQ